MFININDGGVRMMSNKEGMDRRVKKSKAALKEALLALMSEKEFRELTISEIVARADLNRGTFYKHFQYKEDLFNEMIEEVIHDLIESYREPYRNVEVFEVGRMKASGVQIFHHVAKNAGFYKTLLEPNILPRFQNRFSHILKDILRKDLTIANPNSEINYELLASYQAYALLGMTIQWVEGGFKYSPDYMAEQLVIILNHQPVQAVFLKNPITNL
jgi:AcrR family transcriptional regulator